MRATAIALLTVAGLAGVPPADATDGSVSFTCCAYSPATIRVTPGGTVTWTGDFAEHPLRSAKASEPYQSSAGSSFDHTFPTPGRFFFYCNVHGFTTGDDQVGGMSGQVIVTSNQAPVAEIAADKAAVTSGGTVRFDASASTDDHGIADYAWDLDGDGTFETDTGTTPTVSRAYVNPGTSDQVVTVAVRVTDDNADAVGPESSTASRPLTVMPSPPSGGGGPTGGPGPGSTGGGAGGGTVAGSDMTPPHVSFALPLVLKLRTLLRGGVRLRFTTSEAGSARATLRAGRTLLARGQARFTRPGRHGVTLVATSRGRSRLARARRRVHATLTVVVRDVAGNPVSTGRRVRL